VVEAASIPFSKFNKPEQLRIKNGRVYITNDIEGFSKKKVFQYVSLYFVIRESLLKDKKNIIKMDISSLTLKPSALFRKSVFEPFQRLSWSLRIPDEFAGVLVLCAYEDGTHSSFFSYIVLPEEFSRNMRKLIGIELKRAAETRGLSASTEPFVHEYVNREKYKKAYGYDPEIPHDQIKEDEMFHILNIEPCKDMGIIRTAYKRMVKLYHPDVLGETASEASTERMKEIIEAYDYLYRRYGSDE
jgi:DnaJ-class molecular chaperone with C-terminal Zn finger domain